ncbi:ORF3 [Fusarium oxysporum mymonavirus 1]|uniref:ORF3 n=1 Tax=Fusarium oxysporum mymonavirus 1 TaxID=2928187 RepID=A0AAX3A7Q5_9MONO|nr:ORF3 [Fusarium oxysporum mymonavirus 1]UNQ74999.1 ORF3 [Fusarium oxysporum mymonavirus 1]
MSAARYKEKLHSAEEKLLLYQTSASDWKRVAEDQIAAISALGKSTEVVLSVLNEKDNVLDLKVGDFHQGAVWEALEEPSSIHEALTQNIEVLSRYCYQLQMECSHLEAIVSGAVDKIATLTPVQPPESKASLQSMVTHSKNVADSILSLRGSNKNAHREAVAVSPMTALKVNPKRRQLTTGSGKETEDIF